MAVAPPRTRQPGRLTTLACAALLVGSPMFVAYVWLSCEIHGCAVSGPVLDAVFDRGRSPFRLVLDGWPRPMLRGALIFAAWYWLQAVLAVVLPGPTGHGAITPAGHRLAYRLNGLAAWLVTNALLYLAAFRWHWFPPTVVADNWGGLLIAANVAGFLIAALAAWKARRRPTHAGDVRRTGNLLYDFFMGVELNPRIGPIDLKLFHIGHVGMMAWTAVNASFAARQYATSGHLTSSMILVNLMQLIYVLDFFAREDWYLRTIDIHHDRFGFFLAWGSVVWIPFIYTLQAAYLSRHPTGLSPAATVGILALFGAGYGIFLSANRQRDRFRRSSGAVRIWGKEATSIPAPHVTADGAVHESRLLTSGWWGLARHVNYTGDIVMAAAVSLACGVQSALPYFYPVYLAALLLHRAERDDRRCREKYGAAWVRYRALVPYRMLPGIW